MLPIYRPRHLSHLVGLGLGLLVAVSGGLALLPNGPRPSPFATTHLAASRTQHLPGPVVNQFALRGPRPDNPSPTTATATAVRGVLRSWGTVKQLFR